MLELKAGAFIEAVTAVTMLHSLVENMKNRSADIRQSFLEDDSTRTAALSLVRTLREQCVILNATTAIVAIDRFLAFLESSQGKDYYHSASSQLLYVIRTFPDELKGRTLFALNAMEDFLYRDAAPFGDDVANKFTSISYDSEEAAKCLAFGRSTASAFHAIRCLEAGIRSMSRCLGIPDPTKAADRSWFKLLNSIRGEIDKRWPKSSDRLAGDGRYFEEAYAALAALQNPYRNATMHFDHKYTEAEAKHIFEIVKGFMVKLAGRCDEDGMPKA